MINQNKIIIQNIKLLLFSILISLYICEIFLLMYEKNFKSKIENKAYENRLSRKETAKNLGIIYDDRTPLQFYLENKDVFPPMHPTQSMKYEKENNKIEIFPLSGFSNKKTFNCNETGKYNFFQSDKYGFNNNKDKYKKNINSIIVGDSFGFGDCVKYNEGIAYQLNKNGFETLNLSYGGNGPLLQYSTLIEYGFELTPKNIIWLYFDNDLEDLSYELNSKHLSSYLKDDVFYDLKNREYEKNKFLQKRLNSIVLKNKEIAGHESNENYEAANNIKRGEITDNTIIKTLLLQRLIYTLADRLIYLFNNNESDYCQNKNISNCNLVFPTFKKILFNTKNRIEKNNGKITFVFLPVYDRFFRFNKNQDRILYKGQVKKILKDLDINYIDIFDLIENENDPNNFFPMSLSGHYNAYGYKKIAIELKSKLK